MKSDEIRSLFSQFEAAASDLEGVECWSARELQNLLGYSKWENFEKVIQKAKDACSNAGEIIENHFPDIRKMVEIGSNTERPVVDIALTRYACYLIAQNGDSKKEEIAFAQNYFAIQTRRAEIVEQRILEFEKEHIDNNLAVRNMLTQRGIVPENLPPPSSSFERSGNEDALSRANLEVVMKFDSMLKITRYANAKRAPGLCWCNILF